MVQLIINSLKKEFIYQLNIMNKWGGEARFPPNPPHALAAPHNCRFGAKILID
jgi:hypothetical protein